ncbi:unnamed protein product [Larinioides sclopetarius]|uniref:Phosphatidylinositol N-acetylglucosaminyltransferase subunit Q n=1 Tax=Larinioides sclopetarius TaxID=280406 RepID=A0AAV2AZB7_9ARAC
MALTTMSSANMISIFIPCGALNKISKKCWVFGHFSSSSNSIFINCTIFLESSEDIVKIVDKIRKDSPAFSFLGVFYNAKKKKDMKLDGLTFSSLPLYFVLRIDDCSNTFYLENILIKPSQVRHNVLSQIIIYENFDFSKSQMFPSKAISLPEDFKNNFISFLSETLKENWIYSKILSNFSRHVIFDCTEPCPNCSQTKLFMYCAIVVSFLFRTFSYCLAFLPPISFRVKNLISAIVFDLLIGWLITFTFLHSNVPLLLFDLSLQQTNNLVNNLQKLIHWLMGVPAGFKLNIPLNSALGHFFLYHIYLWEAYMAVVLPLFTLILKMSVVIGVLGVTFVLCLLSDLIALATVHIYCFYGYATRLYGYQFIALSSLWRLFRGKKWNPLRQRVDSYTYDIHQLFLGTLIFTVLLFLLPTVVIYYVVFTCLRIMVLVIQRILLKIIQAINVNPLYCAFSRILRSSEVAGDVYFSVLSTKGTLTFSMEVTQVSFLSVIKETLPKLHNTEEYLTWKDFMSWILIGKIIYPL